MKKSKVFIVITRLNNGGAAKHAILLSKFLKGEKFEILLIAGKTESNEDDILPYTKKYNVNPIIVKYLKRSLNPLFDFISFFSIYKLINKERPDIIHTHMSKAGFIGRSAAIIHNFFHKKKIKIVHTFHGHIFHSYFSKIKTAIFILFEKILAKKTDILITISERLRYEIKKKIKIKKKEKLKIISLGIDFIPLRKIENKYLSKKNLKIGMLGRIAPIKNYSLAVDIATILKKRRIPAKIVLGGGGSNEDIRTLSRLEIDNISFVGNIKKPEEFWKNIDIALITSKNEGTPVSLIEAMFSGIPYISSNVGGIQDMTVGHLKRKNNLLIYKNCILVKGFDPKDFVKAIEFYYAIDERIKAGKAAGHFAKTKYSIKRLITDIEALYKNLLNK